MRGCTSRGLIAKAIMAIVLFCASVSAQVETQRNSDPDTLQERIEDLEHRVQTLEQRLDKAKTADTEIPRVSAPEESPVAVKLIGKEFQEGNLLSGEAGDRINIDLEFTSQLKMPVRALTGILVFRDVFDREILRASLTYSEELRPHESLRWHGFLVYQPFDQKHRRLRDLDLKESQTEFALERVIYSDGSRDVFAQPEDTNGVDNKLIAAKPSPVSKGTPKPPVLQQGTEPGGTDVVPFPASSE